MPSGGKRAKSGRSVKPIWSCYSKVLDGLGNVRALCRGCGADIAGQPKRMLVCCASLYIPSLILCFQAHAIDCGKLYESGLMVEVPEEVEEEVELQQAPQPQPAPKRKKLCQPTLSVVRTDPRYQNLIQEAIAKFVVASNLPFAMVDHGSFKGLCELLRPGVKLPSAASVGGPLLDNLFQAEMEKVKRKV